MRVVVNAIPLLSPLTGVGRYTYEISKRLENPTFYYGIYSKKMPNPSINTNSISKFPLLKKIARKILSFRKKEFDTYFEPNFIPLENIKAKKIVTTVHDFSFMNEEWHPKERVEYFKNNFWKNIKRSDVIITDSHFIKDEVKKYLNINAKVVHLGVTEEFKPLDNLDEYKKTLGIDSNFILFVGSIEPRKNLISLIKAYDKLDKELKKEFNLLLVGFKGWKNQEIMELIQKNKDFIKYKGYVDNFELAKLYNLTSLFVFPSFYEGFGLPPLEAMACGAPVLVSNRASLPEVCGNAAEYCEPNEESILEKLNYLLLNESKRKELSQKGLIQASKFSWDKSAKEIEKILKG